MKVGDPKQARILTVIAVGAVAFVVIQLLPGGGPTVGQVSQQIQDRLQSLKESSEKNAEGTRAFPPMLARNVFDHPYLAKSKSEADSENLDKPAKGKTASTETFPDQSVVPPALPGLPELETVPMDGSEESKPKLPREPEMKSVVITVEGVILRPSPTALITVEQESRTPTVGDVIANGYRLLKITEDAVILSHKGKKKTVPVGGSLTL